MAIQEDSIYKHVFDIYDTEHDLIFEVQHLGEAARLLGANLTDAQISEFIEELSVKTVEFEEFEDLVNKLIAKDSITRSDLLKKFEPFDRELDGTVEIEDVMSLLTREGEPISIDEAEEILNDLNPTGAHKIAITTLVDGLLRNELI